MWWNASILLKAWFLALFTRCKWTSWTDQDCNTSNFWGQKWFYRFTSALNVEIFLSFQFWIFKEVETHAFQVDDFCLWENSSIRLENKKTCRSAESQNEQHELKNLISHEIYLCPVTFYLLWKGNMWPHYWEKYLRLNMLWSGRQISCQLTEVKCN